MSEKMGFTIKCNGIDLTTRAQVLKAAVDQDFYVDLAGGPFRDCKLSVAGLDDLIAMLQTVRYAAQLEMDRV